jgi:DNA-binding response OmpR family regulator
MAQLLLVEPNTLLAQTYTAALQHAGFSVAHATGAQTGIDAADAHMPAVVILELQLPEHSGLEFLHEFRSYAEWRDVPVIVNTMLPPSKLRPLAAALEGELGIRAILYKPRTSLDDLLRAVRAHVAAA